MMTEPIVFFDRRFGPGDEQLMARLLAGLVGQPCVSWRKSYGRTGSIHYGALMPRSEGSKKLVYRSQGQWIVGLWDCDRRLILSDGTVFDSRVAGDEGILTSLAQLEGAFVQDIRFDDTALSLRIAHSNGIVLELLSDESCGTQDEQWAVEMPTHQALAMFGKRRWTVQPNAADQV